MQKEYVLEMDNIVKSFAANRVLDGVTIRIKPGEVRALMGENGAGKSTLMKILGGIYSADEGKIAIGGEPVEIKSVCQFQKKYLIFLHPTFKSIQTDPQIR